MTTPNTVHVVTMEEAVQRLVASGDTLAFVFPRDGRRRWILQVDGDHLTYTFSRWVHWAWLVRRAILWLRWSWKRHCLEMGFYV